MVDADKEHGAAWLDGTFPVNTARAEKALEVDHSGPWWDRRSRRFAIALVEDDEVVGGARISSGNGERTCRINLDLASWREDSDALRAESLRLLVGWLREAEVMVVTVQCAADQPETIAAAQALGMVESARLREWFARPGGRADCLVYQALNPRWEVRDA
jgi:RimJ/RimL family protein N-acetyltransferase